jgi:hypothetical protein
MYGTTDRIGTGCKAKCLSSQKPTLGAFLAFSVKFGTGGEVCKGAAPSEEQLEADGALVQFNPLFTQVPVARLQYHAHRKGCSVPNGGSPVARPEVRFSLRLAC